MATVDVDSEGRIWEDCPECGGVGWVSRYAEDPLWYEEDDDWPCETCYGRGGWYLTESLERRRE